MEQVALNRHISNFQLSKSRFKLRFQTTTITLRLSNMTNNLPQRRKDRKDKNEVNSLMLPSVTYYESSDLFCTKFVIAYFLHIPLRALRLCGKCLFSYERIE